MTKAAEITPEREVEIRAAVAQWRHPLPVGTLGRMLADAVAIIDAERAKVAVPEGWKLVPVEPLPEMLAAFYKVKKGFHYAGEPPPKDISDVAAYRALLAATPEPLR